MQNRTLGRSHLKLSHKKKANAVNAPKKNIHTCNMNMEAPIPVIFRSSIIIFDVPPQATFSDVVEILSGKDGNQKMVGDNGTQLDEDEKPCGAAAEIPRHAQGLVCLDRLPYLTTKWKAGFSSKNDAFEAVKVAEGKIICGVFVMVSAKEEFGEGFHFCTHLTNPYAHALACQAQCQALYQAEYPPPPMVTSMLPQLYQVVHAPIRVPVGVLAEHQRGGYNYGVAPIGHAPVAATTQVSTQMTLQRAGEEVGSADIDPNSWKRGAQSVASEELPSRGRLRTPRSKRSSSRRRNFSLQ